MASLNMQATSNPFDLAHVLEFKLRLVASETVEKIEEDRIPKKAEPSELSEEMHGLAEVDEMQELRDEFDDSRLDDISDLKFDGDETEVNKSVPLLEKDSSQELLVKVPAAQDAMKASHDFLPKRESEDLKMPEPPTLAKLQKLGTVEATVKDVKIEEEKK